MKTALLGAVIRFEPMLFQDGQVQFVYGAVMIDIAGYCRILRMYAEGETPDMSLRRSAATAAISSSPTVEIASLRS
ncbi:MAG: hypothetical protein ACYSWO_21075 [Planctomycetota bacterium]|jgi:hypothetical protein